MPLYFPYPSSFIIEFLSVILSAIAYGIVVVLSGNCFHLLQKKWDTYSNHMRTLLLIYIIFMFLCSTWRIFQSVCIFMGFIAPLEVPESLFFLLEFPLAIWGADGFMVRILIIHQKELSFTMQLQVWRCLVLYQSVSRGSRVVIIVLLSLISLASFGRPIYISTPPIQFAHKNF